MEKAKTTVLIVDDDFDFRNQLEIQLKAAGYQVVAAEGQADAEKKLMDFCPDVAVIDLMMENTDGGFALCYHIKKLYPSVPVIIVTAVTSETGYEFDASTAEEKSWIKADRMLTKPVRFEQLDSEIQKLLN